MLVVHPRKVRSAQPSAKIQSVLKTISEGQLREWVERISVPRHFTAEARQNRATARWLHEVFAASGYRVERQGP